MGGKFGNLNSALAAASCFFGQFLNLIFFVQPDLN
jgi:hypothetical protein